ncbi:DUF4652 domain-containing protein [Psychrobacillus sp. INOP01]|uniref:DUF4652 domain-containing protein n=1 Tax=Psychrobacillus sp. INOP01 TaxID=2829187 RepID=UPI001BA80A06|nr:DUF4652 domain-containing protein [Psychrobacillus sp. INOP01]QUG40029.1 DUF4652 domain-containing protein [Psychrobacillus sp. INOP01]
MNEIKQQLLTKMGDTSERVHRIQQQVNLKKSKKPNENKERWAYYGILATFIGLLAFSAYLWPSILTNENGQLTDPGLVVPPEEQDTEIAIEKGDFYEEIKQYLPPHGAEAVFLGGFENGGSTTQTFWLGDHYVQQVISNDGGSVERIYRLNGNQIEIVYEEMLDDVSDRLQWSSIELNKLPKGELFLEAPLDIGDEYGDWTVINTSGKVTTTYGDFTNVLILENIKDDYRMRRYYVPGFGEVKWESASLDKESGEYETIISTDLSTFTLTEEEVITPAHFDMKIENNFKPTFHSPWQPSPSGNQQVTIEGRGEQAGEEGEGILVIENLETDQSTIYKLKDNEQGQYTPKKVEWIDEDRMFVIIGYAHGMVTMGGKLYELNIKDNIVTPIITDLTLREEIMSVKVNQDGTFTYEKHVYDTDNMEQSESHVEDGTLPIPARDKNKEVSFWEDLAHLKTIELTGNGIGNLQGAEILKNTENLFLADNGIVDITSLKDLVKLKYLELSNNQIISIEALEGLTDLDILFLDNNPIVDFTIISKLENITFLSLQDTQLDTLTFVHKMENLNRINIAETKVSDLAPLENLKELTYLDIRGTNITSIKPLVKLGKLQYLLLDKDKVLDWELLTDKEDLRISEEIILAE